MKKTKSIEMEAAVATAVECEQDAVSALLFTRIILSIAIVTLFVAAGLMFLRNFPTEAGTLFLIGILLVSTWLAPPVSRDNGGKVVGTVLLFASIMVFVVGLIQLIHLFAG